MVKFRKEGFSILLHILQRHVSCFIERRLGRSYPEVRRLPRVMIKAPRTKRNNNIPELQTLRFMNGGESGRHQPHPRSELIFVFVIFPPFQKSAKVIPFAVIKIQNEILKNCVE